MKPGLFSCLHKKWFLIFLIFFLFINIITLFTHPIFVDPAMYWFYGHHLRWVYLDAPPLIGIITASATSLLGNSAFTINLLGLCSVLIAARFLYLLSTSLFDESAAKMITMIWLITPATLHFYFRFDWSYQNLVLLFWISSLYFFHETGKTKKPYLFYLTAFSIAAGLLSQIQMFLLVAPLFFILFFLKPYKEFLKNKHFYLAFSLLILLMLPYFISFIESDFLPIRSLLSFHTTTNVSLFSLGTITNFLNDLINEINIFFILGLVLMVKNGKKIFSNNDSLFLLICSAPIFLFFLLISLKTITLIKFYYVFYFGFLLLFYPLTGKKTKEMVMGRYLYQHAIVYYQ
jgi:hypothetical protein